MAGFFASTELGVFSGFGFGKGIESLGQQLMVQATGVLATGVYAGVVSFGLFKLTDALVGLRVDEEQEVMGLDLTQHEERGYIL